MELDSGEAPHLARILLDARLRQIAGLLLQKLKWQYQPQNQTKSWIATIDHQRDQIEALLLDSPSLRGKLADALTLIYPKAVRNAARETGLTTTEFPAESPYMLEEILDSGFLPVSAENPS